MSLLQKTIFLEKSILKFIKVEVTINTIHSKWNATIVKPLIAPPVLNNPGENPEKEPPIIAFLLFCPGLLSFIILIACQIHLYHKNSIHISMS